MHTSRVIGLFSLGLLVTLLAACGGGGGSGSTPPPSSITLTVEDPLGSFNAAAYQVGSGSWQALNMTGTTTKTASFSLNGQSKYGVAVRCSGLVVKVIQATASELPNPKLECSSSSSTPSTVAFTVNVSIDAGLLASGDRVCVNSTNCQSASNTVSIPLNLEAGTRDLLIALADSSNMVKVAKVVKGVNVSSGGSTNVSLAASDQLNPVSFTLPTPPSGYSSFPAAPIFYASASNTGGGGVNASPTSYRPVSGFGSGDRYVALLMASASSGELQSFQFFTGTPSLAFPAPWNAGSLGVNQTAHPSLSGLSRSDNDLRGYQIYLQLTAQLYYTAIIGKSWLGSATTYTLPDLSAPSLLGYTAPSSGSGTFEVTALLSNKPILAADNSALLSFAAGDYLRSARAFTSSYTVGGGNINLP
ncbi:MAG: peptidase S8 and S53 subtilisin kexin sedolisin [Meiothermus ruber]|uniref:Peptidase S8 and S53 subtilisin kexin sedolisin n=1 Tax=Meiothermus ruber TaxID=277 RepID=A0A7C3DBA8_MEIRU|nr:peptidase S8 and S53 subtilisin kexin sedolisin [Meiothermus ruber]